MELKMKAFSSSDWDCFAGASGKPKIAWEVKVDINTFDKPYQDVDSWCVIADKHGIEIQGYDTEGEDVAIFVLSVENQHLSEVILKGMKYPFDYNELGELGFQDIC
ncbi:hypothetical protein DRH13_05890 [Candidatus Woesebacteria bacterium]|nr:MAG: hypothetical protein DRH13_05890 [Candidatus Woesebacteria bacterium]